MDNGVVQEGVSNEGNEKKALELLTAQISTSLRTGVSIAALHQLREDRRRTRSTSDMGSSNAQISEAGSAVVSMGDPADSTQKIADRLSCSGSMSVSSQRAGKEKKPGEITIKTSSSSPSSASSDAESSDDDQGLDGDQKDSEDFFGFEM